MRVLITGSQGFLGKNLILRLKEIDGVEVLKFSRDDSLDVLSALIAKADVIVHLAGANRPKNVADFTIVNIDLIKTVCDFIKETSRKIPLILTSSTQAELNNPYGYSKRAAEQIVEQFAHEYGNPVDIYRLPSVFGKWCKPNYNSVVATFCYNIANDLSIQINDPAASIHLVYIDDVITELLNSLTGMTDGVRWGHIEPIYTISLGELADQIKAFNNCRTTLVSEHVGSGLIRALYATYVSYLPTTKFSYDLPSYGDERGVFVEMLKTINTGQFSYFTAHPGVTRGGHYHHTKTEKFLVVKGKARFGFRHMVTNEAFELFTIGDKPQIVETVPGWTHNITNVGDSEMVVMLWANEIFDRNHPDTITSKVSI